MTSNLDKLAEQVQKIADREDCYLYDLELVGAGKNRVLRVFIDKDSEEGVTVDDCSRVSRGLDLILDVEDLVSGGGYNLEVSSPGLSRHLKQPWHYEKVIGKDISLNLKKSLGEICTNTPENELKRKKLNGQLLATSDGALTVKLKVKGGVEEEFLIPLAEVQKAKLEFDYDKHFNKQKPKK